MSSSKRTTRRISLLAGSSFVAASLSAAVPFVLLTPTAAMAAAACAPAPSSGGGTDSVTYADPAYAAGIDCDSGGNMSVSVTTDGVDIGGQGIVLTGAGADSVTFNGPNASSSQRIDGVGLTGALVNIATGSGDIIVDAGGLDVSQSSATATHGLLATSASGDIDVTLIDVSANADNGQTGVWAATAGGGSIDLTTRNTAGRLYGIYAEVAGGGGGLTINSSFVSADATAGIAGIRGIVSGSGALTITGFGDSSAATSAAISATSGTGLLTITGGAVGRLGTAYLVDADGDVVINNTGRSGGVTWGIDVTGAAGRTVTVNNSNGLFGGNTNSSNVVSGNAIRVQGAGAVVINTSDVIGGRMDFTGLAGAADINVLDGGRWHHSYNTSVLSASADRLDVAAGGQLVVSIREADNVTTTLVPAVIDFGGGSDVVTNAGTIVVGTELRLTNLEEFHHTGLILLGALFNQSQEFVLTSSDGRANDILAMPGVHFFGEGGRVILDVNTNGPAQSSCSSSLRDSSVDRNMPSADCLDITGGVTEGTTPILVNDTFPNDRGTYNPEGVVLVDVSGGTSAQGHFTLDAASDSYNPDFGGVIDKGYFVYALGYDTDTQQHKLYGVPGSSPAQAPLLAQSAHGLWRLTTGTWFDRQADLRGDDGTGGGWLRVSGETADRDVLQTQAIGSASLTFDNTFNQQSYAVTGGVDLMRGGGEGQDYVLGVMAGYANSKIEFDVSPNTAQMDGWTGGAYASFISDGLFVDAAVNANKLILKYDVPALPIFPAGTILDTDLVSVGAQVEAGWRFPIAGAAFIEPLAAASYVRTSYDDMVVAARDPVREGLVVEFDDPTSLRASLGARAGLDQDFGVARMQFSVLGRVWNEFEGENSAILHNPGDDVVLTEKFAGQFKELGLNASIWSPGGAVSGFLAIGGKFGDDYEAQSASAGVRVAW